MPLPNSCSGPLACLCQSTLGQSQTPAIMRRGGQDGFSLSRNSHIPACVECRARKAKCSKERPSCYHCRSINQPCVYPPKPTRTPLTRQHLSAVEDRLQSLETAMERLFPDGQMESVIRSLLTESPDIGSFGASLAQGSMVDAAPGHDAWVSNPLAADSSGPDPGSLGQLPMEVDLPMDLSYLTSDGADPLSWMSEPGSSVTDEVYIRAYFHNYHPMYPFIHEATFVSRYQGSYPVSEKEAAWSILVNMVLAIGAWSIADNQSDVDRKYFERAKDYLKKLSMFERGNITLLQALLLLNVYNEKCGNPKESWHFLGLAVRMAIDLGLHNERTYANFNQSLLDQEIQRRVWWTVYCLDSCSSKIHGLPLLLPEDRLITVHPVSNILDESLTPQTSTPPPKTDAPTIYTGLIQQSSYHRLANSIYRRLLSTDTTTAQEIKALDDMINTWHAKFSRSPETFDRRLLPQWAILARDRQTLCDQSLRLLIHRPALLRWLDRKRISADPTAGNEPLSERQCRANAVRMARDTIRMVTTMIDEGRYSKITLSFTLYALFHAVLVPVIHLHADPASPDSITWQRDIKETGAMLSRLAFCNDALSSHFLVILDRICSGPIRDQQRPLSSTHAAVKPADLQPPSNDIFGNHELGRLAAHSSTAPEAVTFSEWTNTNH
ncbi:hypothetical protein BO94DRAFT_141598 [Aspergillus sclerotioniger CBS 115572]|uniref:Zn(2)-C6 fungal-type domain-containing protein n=1 Tax=Aspergillus sclerotioniger CBS 115572 TaxID=1450535 RepID=A0A317XFP3_9EURO|nr:hypothetical protein BO94DRAFT_141598 [Aspergillus sclerotioniger CBS 115572]PWY95938.1 hypothetical protein BO94DRAFT_141598 [Aspergillus sclerotioniger CBS 115572]